MKTLYRLLSWTVSIAIIICVPLFGWKVLLHQTREEANNPYEYNIDRYKSVPEKLLTYNELPPIKLSGSTFHAIAVDSDKNIFASIDSKIIKMNPSGDTVASAETKEPCFCLTTLQNSMLYLGMQNHVETWDTSLRKINTWQSIGENARLTSLSSSPTHLYAADSGSRLVWKFTLNGKLVTQIPDASTDKNHFVVPSPYFDVAVGNSVWIANPGRTRVESYGPNDNLSTTWGRAAMEIEGFSGCCNPSHIAITPDGNIVTAEKGLPRIKIYSPDGTLLSVAAGPNSFLNTSSGCYTEALIKDIAVDADGRILVLDRAAAAIRIFIKKN